MEHREQNHRTTERLQNKGQKMKREGEKIQTIVKTYTQNGEGSERRRKKAVTWGGKCKEEKKHKKKLARKSQPCQSKG